MELPWRIRLLGGLRAEQGSRTITRFHTHKTAALFAYLAYYPNRTHSRDELVEMLWPDSDLDSGRVSLRQALSALRRQLEPPGTTAGGLLIVDRSTVHLDTEAITTDVAEFESALQAAKTADTRERAQALDTAIGFYRGPLLPEYYEEWTLLERDRLAESYQSALQQLTYLCGQAGDLGHAIDYALRALRADSLREEAHQNLILLYARTGRAAAALKQYQELENIWQKELGMRPSAASRALAEALRADPAAFAIPVSFPPVLPATECPPVFLCPPGAAAEPRTTPDASASPRLPLQWTRFFGREAELDQLVAMLLHGHLVTLTGPGGSGKTRLALEVARRLESRFQGAIWFVPLAALTDPRLLLNAVAEALQLRHTQEPLEQMVTCLARQPALLLLDNIEQLLEIAVVEPATVAVAAREDDPIPAMQTVVEVIQTLRERVPTLTCLVTSRQRINIAGELEFPVLPLSTPSKPGTQERLLEFASVQLFVDRARAVRPDFQMTPRNAAAVASLCERLEGIPLAIELAAAWTQEMTPVQMLQRLSRRFDLLVSRRKDLPPRHRTLRAAVESSHRLLPVALQQFFDRLSVFRGGWTLEAAEQVCCADEGKEEAGRQEARKTGKAPPAAFQNPKPKIQNKEVLHFLAQLRERSLILTEEVGAEMRFRMLETLREYAWEQLDIAERQALQLRHADYYLALAEAAAGRLAGVEQAAWLKRLETENDNLRAALHWSLEEAEVNSSAIGLRLAAALWYFWSAKSYVWEGREWLTTALSRPAISPLTPERAMALNGAGMLALTQRDLDSARVLLEESLAIGRALGHKARTADALDSLAFLFSRQGDLTAARSGYEQALDLYREIGYQEHLGYPLNGLGEVALYQGDYAAARDFFTESLAIHRQNGNQYSLLWALYGLGNAESRDGDYTAAGAHLEASLSIARETGNTEGIAWSLLDLGNIAYRQGDDARAQAYYDQSLPMIQALGNPWCIAGMLGIVAHIAANQDNRERAARLLGAAEALREAIRAHATPPEWQDYERSTAAAQAALGDTRTNKAWQEGQTFSLEQAVTYALQDSQPDPDTQDRR